MEWWQCFLGGGAFGVLLAVFNTRVVDLVRWGQDANHAPVRTVAETMVGMAVAFLLSGLLLGTPVWFGYWLFID